MREESDLGLIKKRKYKSLNAITHYFTLQPFVWLKVCIRIAYSY